MMSDDKDLIARLKDLRDLAHSPGDPIRYPRRAHIEAYHCALVDAWETGALVPALALTAANVLLAGAFEAAAQAVDTAGDSAVTEALGQRLCCTGHHCGCQGADVGAFLLHLIRALTPADAVNAARIERIRRDNEVRRECATIAYDHTPAKHGGGTLAAHVTGATIEKAILAQIQHEE